MFAVVCGVTVLGGEEIDEFLGVAEMGRVSQSEAEQAVRKVLDRLAAPPEQLELYPEFFVFVYSASLESKMMYQVANPHYQPEEPDRRAECERLRRENERLRQELSNLECDLEYQYEETLRAAESAATYAAEDAERQAYWDGYRDGLQHTVRL
jgi:hypothetical protein